MYLELEKLAYYHLTAGFLYILCAYFAKKVDITAARILFFIVLNLAVTVTASYIGRAGHIEYVYMYSLALPFTMFSFNNEKKFVYLFSCLSGLLWIILNLTDFNLFTENQLDQELAATLIYPIASIFAIMLITSELVFFSLANIRQNAKIFHKRQYALETSEAKSKFLSIMSHEIRTPLNAVIGLSHILGDSEPRKDQIDNIEALNYSGKLLLHLLNNVLDFSKMQSTVIELDYIPTNITSAVKQIKKIHRTSCERKGIELNIRIDDDLPIVLLDIVRYNQVIHNLISNGIKFTDNGSVTLIIKKNRIEQDKIVLHTEVRDTGIGISKYKQEIIWEPFEQASHTDNRIYGGTGLGLPIVKSIIDAMNSKVKILSKTGKGTRFYFDLTLDIVDDLELQKNNKKEAYNFSGKKVLLVDDNFINIMVSRQILEKVQLEVTAASDGLEAVNKMKENSFDIVLMDIQMPIMDGYTATEEIRKFDKKTPIIALSANVFSEIKNKIEECGMSGFIFKPFTPEELLKEIEKFTNHDS
jgi:signal transduction histidine kinase/CheY-like chemotaxis protein